MRADERQQPVLPLGAFAPELGEAGRDDAERARPGRSVLGRLEDDSAGGRRRRGRRARQLVDRGVAATPATAAPVAVHRVRRAGEPARDDVAEELAADRPGPRDAPSTATLAGSKKGAATRRPPRGRARPPAPGKSRRRRSGLELEGPLVELAGHVEAGVPEHAEHGDVPGQDLGDEALDPVGGRVPRELLEQAGADAAARRVVGDREGHLRGGRVTQAVVGRTATTRSLSVRRERPDQRAAIGPVRLERVADQRGGSAGIRGSADGGSPARARPRGARSAGPSASAGGRSRSVLRP